MSVLDRTAPTYIDLDDAKLQHRGHETIKKQKYQNHFLGATAV
jgi:hypothetical protein